MLRKLSTCFSSLGVGSTQVEPDRLAGNGGAGAQFEAREALGLGDEGAQHVSERGASR